MYHRSKELSFQAALRDIRAHKPTDRVAAAERLSRTKGDEEQEMALAALAKAVADPRPEVRSTACVSIAALGDVSSWEILVLCLDDEIGEVRQCAAIGLGSLGAAQSFPALLNALQNGPPDMRFQAASSLVEIDADASYAPLLAALSDSDDPQVLGAVALSLGAIGNASCADQIASLLDHEHADCRLDAACALAQFKDLRAKETLAAALLTPDGAWDAITALEQLGEVSIDCFAHFLSAKRGDERVQIRASGALLSQDPTHPSKNIARQYLSKGLLSRKLELRGLAIQELHKVGSSWAIAPLHALSKKFRGRSLLDEIHGALQAITDRSQSSSKATGDAT